MVYTYMSVESIYISFMMVRAHCKELFDLRCERAGGRWSDWSQRKIARQDCQKRSVLSSFCSNLVNGWVDAHILTDIAEGMIPVRESDCSI